MLLHRSQAVLARLARAGAMSDAEGSEGDEGLPHASPATCVVCCSQPPTILSLVCGHVVLCAGCCAALKARGGEQHCCPVCRGSPGGFIDFADTPDGDWTGGLTTHFIPAESRLRIILAPFREAAPDSRGEAVGERCLRLSALGTLGLFSEHGPQEQLVALQGGALDAAVTVMRQKSLSRQALIVAGVAAAIMTKVTDGIDTSKHKDAWERSNALDHVLHALRLLKGSVPDAMLAPLVASVTHAFKVLPFRAMLGSRALVSLAKLVCSLSASNDPGVDDTLVMQELSLVLLATLASSKACRSLCIAEMLRTVRASDSAHSLTLKCAVAVLHTVIVEFKPAQAAACCRAALDTRVNGVATLLNACLLLCDCGCDESLEICGNWLLPTIAALCCSTPAALLDAVHNGCMTVFAHVAEAAAEQESPELSFSLFQELGRLLFDSSTDDAVWRDARAAAAAAAVSAGLPQLITELSCVAAAHASHELMSGSDYSWTRTASAALPVIAGLLQRVELSWERDGFAGFCQIGAYVTARSYAEFSKDRDRGSQDFVTRRKLCDAKLLAAFHVLRAIEQKRREPEDVQACCTVVRVVLTALSAVASEAVQVAACRLLTFVVLTRGADVNALDLVSRAVSELPNERAMPLAALLTPCAVQRTKPALRAAALHTLALALAIAVAAEDTDAA